MVAQRRLITEHVRGLNSVGLRRASFSSEERKALKDAYRILFRKGLALEDALKEMAELKDDNVGHLINFIRNSKRGFTRAARDRQTSDEESLTV